jgi:hypothetical protein
MTMFIKGKHDVGKYMQFNFIYLLIFICTCNFQNFIFRVIISLILGIFNVFLVKLRSFMIGY